MKTRNSSPVRWSSRIVAGLLLTSLLLVLPGGLLAADEQRFNSPQAAMDALKAAVEATDTNALHAIFGQAGHRLVSADVVEAAMERELFMRRVKEKVNLVSESDSKVGAATGRRRLALSHSAGEAGWAMALRHRGRRRGNPQPAHRSK
jgi:hypothetical protein